MLDQKKLVVLRDKIESVIRKLVRFAAIVVLCYLAWRGASGLVSPVQAGVVASYAVIIALISLILLI
jgi:hypothetical protein